jgi:DNA-binding transcriptional ArsR family regulator
MTYQTTLLALADPTRRRLFERLRRRPYTVGELARAQSISQPAVSQHLRALRQARLVAVRPEGTRRYYHATPAGLEDLKTWLEAMWDDVLTA